jgi:hypothetical protein
MTAMAMLGVLAIGVSFSRPPRAVQASPQAAMQPGRVITRLVGQRQTITITSTPEGVRYSVAVDGKTILAGATIEELRLKNPESFRQIQSSIANTSPETWAGMDTAGLDR